MRYQRRLADLGLVTGSFVDDGFIEIQSNLDCEPDNRS